MTLFIPKVLARLHELTAEPHGRFALTGIRVLDLQDGRYRLEATDGKRLLIVHGPSMTPSRGAQETFAALESVANGGTDALVPSADWKTAMRRRAVSTRAALSRHRWAVGQMEGRTTHGPANLRLHDAALGCLRAAGFSLEMTVHAYSVQDAYINGLALQETDMASETADDFAAEAQRQMTAYEDMLADYPNLVEIVGGHVATAGYDYETEFLFGLDLILDGLDRLR